MCIFTAVKREILKGQSSRSFRSFITKIVTASWSPDVILSFQIQAEMATPRKFENKLFLTHGLHCFHVVNMNLLSKIILKLIQDYVADIIFNKIKRD